MLSLLVRQENLENPLTYVFPVCDDFVSTVSYLTSKMIIIIGQSRVRIFGPGWLVELNRRRPMYYVQCGCVEGLYKNILLESQVLVSSVVYSISFSVCRLVTNRLSISSTRYHRGTQTPRHWRRRHIPGVYNKYRTHRVSKMTTSLLTNKLKKSDQALDKIVWSRGRLVRLSFRRKLNCHETCSRKIPKGS